jgi:hypothetical protein
MMYQVSLSKHFEGVPYLSSPSKSASLGLRDVQLGIKKTRRIVCWAFLTSLYRLLYGEGREKALMRLQEATDKPLS